MQDEIKRFWRLVKWVLVSLVVLTVVLYAANVTTNQRLVMRATGTWLFSWVSGITDSPSGRYVVGIQSSGLQGVAHSVKVARRFSLWPTEVMSTSSEDFKGKGPEEKTLALVWGRGDGCVALMHHGWFVDFYDLGRKQADSWSHGLYITTDRIALAGYHQRIEEKLGSDRNIQIIQE
jgi:hypothetical protein